MQVGEFKEECQNTWLEKEPRKKTMKWLSWMKTFCTAYYHCYSIRKPNNRGVRSIEAPKDILLSVQQTILEEFQDYEHHPAAHGLDSKDYVKNALVHKNSKEYFSLDLKNFYNNCTLGQVRRNISNQKARGLIERYTAYIFFAGDKAFLPYKVFLATGSPLSPMVANLAMVDIDHQIQAIADKWGAFYTRYLDDMNLSFPEQLTHEKKLEFSREVVKVVQDAGWPINWRKTRWLNPNHDPVVITGVDLRSQPKVTRRYIVEKVRPGLNNLAREMIRDVSPEYIPKGDNFLSVVTNTNTELGGSLAYIKYVSPEQYEKVRQYFFKRVKKASEKASLTDDDFKKRFKYVKEIDLAAVEKKYNDLQDKSDLEGIILWATCINHSPSPEVKAAIIPEFVVDVIANMSTQTTILSYNGGTRVTQEE